MAEKFRRRSSSHSAPRAVRIGVDARFYGVEGVGLGRYTRELVTHIASGAAGEELVLFVPSDAAIDGAVAERVEVRRSDVPHYSVREQLRFGRQLRAANLDLMHFTNFNFPWEYRRPFVVTIPDLVLLRYPGRGRASRLRRPAMRALLRAGVRRSQRVLTVSAHQRDLIAREFGADPAKIAVTYEGIDRRFRPLDPDDVARWRAERDLAEPFVLFTGQWYENKNVPRLIRAFARIRREMPMKLVLVGRADPAFRAVPEAIAREDLGEQVRVTGFVEDEDLVRYYNAADVFVFPSLVEGFGLPPLEAMACGTAVAASHAPPMPEILGDAPAYFDPQDVEGMAATVLRLLDSPEERAALAERGLHRASQYSWAKSAEATLAVYRAALSDRPPARPQA